MISQHKIRIPNGAEVHICSKWKAQAIHEKFDWVVSLCDPASDPGFRHEGTHLIFHVDDTEHPTDLDVLLTRSEVEQMLDLKLQPGQRGLVHCHAGVSRSTAVGSMIAFKNGSSINDICEGLDWDLADPNVLILRWSETLMGVDLATPITQCWLLVNAEHQI